MTARKRIQRIVSTREEAHELFGRGSLLADAPLPMYLVTVDPAPPARGRTVREAIAIALEPVNARPSAMHSDPELELVAVRNHVMAWVHSYAERRGVILEDRDIAEELDAVLAELRGVPCG